MTAEEKIHEIVNKIVKEFHPEKIILFGSWAWGRPDESSDLDLLVIQNSTRPRLERERELRELLLPSDVAMDVFVLTPEELDKSINENRNLFLEDIIRNGQVLFEQPGFEVPLFHKPAELIA